MQNPCDNCPARLKDIRPHSGLRSGAWLLFLCSILSRSRDRGRFSVAISDWAWRVIDLEAVVETANKHMVTQALWVTLNRKGLVERFPMRLRHYMEECYKANVERNRMLKHQIKELVGRLNSANIVPMLLKGSARLATDPTIDPGSFVLEDLDIMVPNRDAQAALEELFALGYRWEDKPPEIYAGCQHLRPLVRSSGEALIELHTRLYHKYDYPCVLTPEEVWESSCVIEKWGLSFRVLSVTHQIVHHVAHSEIHHDGYGSRSIYVRGLLDFDSMYLNAVAEAHWEEALEVFRKHGVGNMLRAYAFTAGRFLGSPSPKCLGPTLLSVCHYSRCLVALALERMRDRWERTRFGQALVRVGRALSCDHVLRLYGHPNSRLQLSLWRAYHLLHLIRKYCLSPHRRLLPGLLLGNEPKRPPSGYQ